MSDAAPIAYAGPVTPADAGRLVLSLFPGIDLFGRGFEAEGFTIVRGPDLIFGGDIRGFHPPRGVFAGVILGSPCQDFSAARRDEPTGEGLELLGHGLRCIEESQPDWFILENVPRVPSVTVRSYRMQRVDLDARECGSAQRRLRHFQFGSRHGLVISVTRLAVTGKGEATCTASEGRRKEKRDWPAFCALQGLPPDFALPSFTKRAAYSAVGNGVPLPMGRAIAHAVTEARHWATVKLCACSCGRRVTGKQILATMACRQRVSRAARRDAARNGDNG